MDKKVNKQLNIIRQRIMQRRKALNYSYQDLADITHMSKSTLQRYETGNIGNLPLDKLEKLAGALECSPSYLMGWTDEEGNSLDALKNSIHIEPQPRIFQREEDELIGDYRALNAKGQEEARKRVKELLEISRYRRKGAAARLSPVLEERLGNTAQKLNLTDAEWEKIEEILESVDPSKQHHNL